VAKSSAAQRFFDNTGPIAIAHRGGAGIFSTDRYRRENTLDVFRAATKLGYKYLEIDVTATSDNKVVLLHVTTDKFEALLRKPSAPNAIKLQRLSYDELKRHLQRDILTLSDVLRQFPSTKFLIDTKTDKSADLLPEEITKSKALDRVFLNSFYIKRVLKLQKNLGHKVPYGWIIGRYSSLINRNLGAVKSGDYLGLGLTALVLPFKFTDRQIISQVHSNKLRLITWTPNARHQISQAVDLNVDGIISDRADLLKTVLLQKQPKNKSFIK
jgi:glycerophosphoryl diester phosphodiesterase